MVVYDEINILVSSISQKTQYNSTMPVMLRKGTIFVLKEELLSSYLMPADSFISFCSNRSTDFPYFRAILFRRYCT